MVSYSTKRSNDLHSCGKDNCLDSRKYKVTCKVTGGICNPCTAESEAFHVYPNRFEQIFAGDVQVALAGAPNEVRLMMFTITCLILRKLVAFCPPFPDFDISVLQGRTLGGFFAGIHEDGSFLPSDGSFLGTITSAARLVPTKRKTYSPWFMVADAYGNLNTNVSGVGRISLPFPRLAGQTLSMTEIPNMAGYRFCQNKKGTACLSGTLETSVEKGVGSFPNVYIRHPGPGFQFEYEYGGKVALSKPFNVLPPPPRVTGISFSDTFSAILIHFDAPTNLAGMEDSTDCAKIFAKESLLKLSGNEFGNGAHCSWPELSVLLATLGNNAQLHPGDPLSFSDNTIILSSIRWRPVVQAGGIISNQRMYASDARVQRNSAVIELTSCPMPTLERRSVILPESISRSKEIEASHKVSTADIEHFTIDGSHYLAVANHCQGPNCYFSIDIMYTLAQYDIDSIIFQWTSDGSLREHQRIPTHGATDVKSFTTFDALNTGGYARQHFLAISNARTDNKDTPDTFCQIFIWENNPINCKDIADSTCFVFRQKIPTIGGTSVDVLEHGTDLFIVLTNTGPNSYISILRWVPGSFRRGADGSSFEWVSGLFDELVQTIPTDGAMSAILYHPFSHSALYLAASSFVSQGSNQVHVKIYRWREDVCNDNKVAASMQVSCFDHLLSIPAFGARTITPFSISDKTYLAFANHFNGDALTEQSVHYELDSFIYAVDYTTGSFQLHQVGKPYNPL
jgi:hypothetical protein